MSLTLYVDDGVNSLPDGIVQDIEVEFDLLKLEDTELNRKLLFEIEQGFYISPHAYKDRFGYKLRIDDMSTGCKACLCAAQNPNKTFSFKEVGLNARDIAIKTLTAGAIVINDTNTTISGDYETIDVIFDGKHFDTVLSLNNYLFNEY